MFFTKVIHSLGVAVTETSVTSEELWAEEELAGWKTAHSAVSIKAMQGYRMFTLQLYNYFKLGFSEITFIFNMLQSNENTQELHYFHQSPVGKN